MFLVLMFLLDLLIKAEICGGDGGDAAEQQNIKDQIEDLEQLGLSVADLLEVEQLTQTLSQHDMDTLAELLDRQAGSGVISKRIQHVLKLGTRYKVLLYFLNCRL